MEIPYLKLILETTRSPIFQNNREFRILAAKYHVDKMAAVDHSEPVAHSLSSDSTYIAQMEAGATADATRLISKITETSLGQRWNPCLTLENSGSVARDHLASERTFLAYARTSLAIAGTGVGECNPVSLFWFTLTLTL